MTPRFGQLAYTSFDAVGSAGGWQVKQTSGELTPTETQALLAGVQTVFRPVVAAPEFPTGEQLEQRPRRLAYRRVEAGAALWHTVPAGSDSTGRPGNVFAHALLDRTPDTQPRYRAIQWWRAPHWLWPYGAAAVARAEIGGEAPELGSAVSKDSVLAFVLDPAAWRLGTLFVLLDAVAAALAGGPAVVLGAHSPDSAAQWIGLLSFLMSPGTASALTFSTFDRADQVPPHDAPVLSAVPVEDLDAVAPGLVVIGESEKLSLGELDGDPHRTVRGHQVAVTRWSVMAQVVLLDRASARRVLDDIDELSTQVRDDRLDPAWPMALAVAGDTQFADAHAEAHEVVLAHSPPGAVVGSEAARITGSVFEAAVGATTADAWRARLELPEGAGASFADATYFARAIADEVWLAQDGSIPLGPRTFHGKPTPLSLRTAIGPAIERSRRVGPDRLLRVIDLLLRAGVTDDRLRTGLLDEVLPGLKDTGVRARVESADRWSLAAILLRHGDLGVVDDDLLDWLTEDVAVPPPSDLAAARPWDEAWTRAALRAVRSDRLGPGRPGDAGAQLWWLRMTEPARFESAAAATVWEPSELMLAVGTEPPPGAAALRTLVGAADSADLRRLAAAVLGGNGHADGAAVACAAVRHIEPREWLQQGYLHTHQHAYAPVWDRVVTDLQPDAVHPDFSVRLLSFALLGVLAGQSYPLVCNVIAAEDEYGGRAVARVLPLVDGGALAPVNVVAVGLLRSAAAEAVDRAPAPVDRLARRLAGKVATSGAGVDADSVVGVMAQLSGDSSEATLRGYRRMVGRLARGDAPSLAERLRGSR